MRIKALFLRLSTLLALAVVSDSQGSVRLTTLYTFHNVGHPTGRLLQDQQGNFYGTASGFEYLANQPFTLGAVFKISPQGELLWQLQLSERDGVVPLAGLCQDEQGFLYGTAVSGGAENQGTVFKISPDGKLVWSKPFHGADGARPTGEMVRACDGSFFGTTLSGGAYYWGTVFRITSSGVIKTVYSFSGLDGAQPSGGLVRGADGYFYGTTWFGGPYFSAQYEGMREGTIFRMSCEGALTTVYTFGSATNITTETGIQGMHPTGQLIQRNDGCFYGVTEGGPTFTLSNFWASVFKFDPNGTLSTLLYFNPSESDSTEPAGPLVTGYDGSLYGVTTQGGASPDDGLPGYGTIFKITPSGAFLNVVSFHGANGRSPFSGLIKGKDGNLYGTTKGNDDFPRFPGTLFKLSISRPVISIAHRQQLVHPTNAVVTVTGQTKSRASVLDVFYQLNGGDWTEATTTNEWKNWTATVTLSPGKNILRAYAVDSTGDLSRTSRVRLLFEQP